MDGNNTWIAQLYSTDFAIRPEQYVDWHLS